MPTQPMLKTPRLELRPFRPDDAPSVRRLAGRKEIAATTISIPHPYSDGIAGDWIARHAAEFAEDKAATFAITLPPEGTLIGAIGLTIQRAHDRAEMGYWIGLPWWNQGYATEAARAVIDYGFRDLALNRIFAHHFAGNRPSGRVMEKAGMKLEGTRRQAVKKCDAYLDIVEYGILRSDPRP